MRNFSKYVEIIKQANANVSNENTILEMKKIT